MKILAKECGLIGNFRDVGTRRVVETPQVLAIRRRVPTDGNPPRQFLETQNALLSVKNRKFHQLLTKQ